MVATAFFVMHVQVATRFLSSSPPIYWFASYVLTSHKGWGYLIWGYSAAYILIGTLLFSNFYPFT
ncbi:putative GPI mannosyltransferase 2 [Helianthus annuus]|uniref:GPI mannosyltransferase 2 n=2 Tax=Helianthus annuus TaxID=4232 RepID=A0A9K3IN81_HELAN|nr:putative GPI mannosyltransferase 2 [Helianthus annuus]KAJ0905511.1 putative GPI mannosyltransferase 2 [Helianthus annuus]